MKLKAKNINDNVSMPRLFHLQKRAMALFASRKYTQGTKIIQELRRRALRGSHENLVFGAALRGLGLENRAVPLLRAAVDDQPNESALWLALGLALCWEERRGEAEACFEQAVTTNPRCPLSLAFLAASPLMLEKSPARAEQLLLEADRLKPREHFIWVNLGFACASQGKRAEAQKAFRIAIEINPEGEGVENINEYNHQNPPLDDPSIGF